MRSIFTMLFISGAFRVAAQTLSGTISDSTTGAPLQDVSVLNIGTRQSAESNAEGHFTIAALPGDSVSFFSMGYVPAGIRVKGSVADIRMAGRRVDLKEFVLHSPLSPYQMDSMARRELYRQELGTEPVKPHYTGLGVDNLFSAIAQHFSRKYKQNKKFKKTFEQDERQHFIDSRYTPGLTPLTGDDLAVFMNTFPMDYSFARSATDLELKMWIRNNYKRYTSNSDNK